MFGKRREELLAKAAELFAQGSDPFATDFLRENNVKLEECYTLSEDIATLIKSFLACPLPAQATIVMSGIAKQTEGMDISLIWQAYAQRKLGKDLDNLLEELKKVKL